MGKGKSGSSPFAEELETDYLENLFGAPSDEDEIPESEPRNATNADWQRLEVMLQRLPARIRETVRLCWDEDPYMKDIGVNNRAASNYWDCYWECEWNSTRQSGKRLEANELESEIEAIIATARDLKGKLERVNWESLNLIRNTLDAQAGKDGRQYFEEARNIKDWFKLSWWDCFDDGYDSDDEVACAKNNCKFGTNIGQLELLAQTLEPIAKEFSARKQAPNGKRDYKKFNRIEYLIRIVWKSLAKHQRPKAHVLPIARIIHEWATDGKEIPGPTWGDRPLKRILDEERGSAPRR